MTVIDLFAGPGGWDVAARRLGMDPIGLEWDDAACATRRAAGLRTMQCDVGAVDLDGATTGWKGMGVMGLIASPPCQAFSMAGLGAGRAAIDAYLEAVGIMRRDGRVPREWLDERCHDERAHLVLEPLRWAQALRPEWVCLEQVKEVLPIWEAMAPALEDIGFSTWTGLLSSERFGVPQTRVRAVLIASRTREVCAPPATHQRWVAPRRKAPQEEGLFALDEPQRIVHPDDRDLLPWVAMAEALGWAPGAVGFPRLADDGDAITLDGVEYRERDLRDTDQPAFALTEKARSWTRWYYRNGNQENAARRRGDEPAPTLLFGHALNSGVEWTTTPDEPWRPPSAYNSRGQRDTRSGEVVLARQRTIDEPAPTIAGESRNDTWVHERPATTVVGDPRIAGPGHKRNADDADDHQGRMTNSVRVTLEEALVLQSFPGDYPVQGTNTKQFEQVGNAIPPGMAEAILEVVT